MQGCPFCGQFPARVEIRDKKAFVVCRSCDARGPAVVSADGYEATARSEAWRQWDIRAEELARI